MVQMHKIIPMKVWTVCASVSAVLHIIIKVLKGLFGGVSGQIDVFKIT